MNGASDAFTATNIVVYERIGRTVFAAEVAERQRLVQDAAVSIGLISPSPAQPLFQVVSPRACRPGPYVTDRGLIDGTTGER